MRTIKFRGKRVDNGQWIEGLLYFSHGTGEWKITTSNGWVPSYSNPDEGESTDFHSIIPETVGQFTGREVGNVKIFEGDLFKRKNKIYEVIYDDYMCAFMLKCESAHKKYYFDHFDIWGFDFIGNIFENTPPLAEDGITTSCVATTSGFGTTSF